MHKHFILELIILFGVFSFAHLMERRDNLYTIYNLLHVLSVSLYGVLKYKEGLEDKEGEKC